MKGLSPMISFVFTVLFITLAVAIVLTAIKPTLQKSKAFAIYSEGTQNLQLLDSAIREVASEARGSKRTVYLTVTDGVYEVDPNKNLLYFKYKPPINLGLSGRTGNAWIEEGFVTGDWFNNYPENDNASENWYIISGNWKVTGGMYSGTNGTAYLHVNKELDGFSFAVDMVDESGKGEAWVDPVDPRDLVGYWSFDEGSGTVAYDWSGHNNTGTLKDANSTNGDGSGFHGQPPAGSGTSSGALPEWVDGKFGKALSFDGESDYVDCGNDESLNIGQTSGGNGLTLMAWVKAGSTLISDAGIIDNNNLKYGLTYHNAYKIYFYIYTGSNFVSAPMSYGEWHHVVGVWDGTTGENSMKLYIDGELVASKASDYDRTNASGPVYIGKRVGGNSFEGIIDEVRIYNRSLTEAEIKALYEAGLKKLNSTTRKARITSRFSPYIVLSNPFGTTYFDNFIVNSKKDKTIFVIIPYNRIDLQGHFRISKGNQQIVIENVGVDAEGKPIIKIESLS